MIDKALSLVAPHICCGCGKTGSLLCNDCKYDIIKDSFTGCILCEARARRGVCRKHRSPLREAWVVGERKATLQRLIGAFKFRRMAAADASLAGLLDEVIPPLPPRTQLVPIPTVRSHVRLRGYDHTARLARKLARLRGLRFNRALSRRGTASQNGASRSQRREQAALAYFVNDELSPDTLYVLVDDVVTTGATLLEAAAAMQRAGARHIAAAVVAKQPLD